MLKQLLSRSGVVVIRDQQVTDDDFATFLSRLGPLTFTQGEKAVAHCPQLNIVSNVGRKRPPRSVFHTDTSYVSAPPAYTALRAVILPSEGGETLFSSQYLAFDTLPTTVKEQLQHTKVLHVVTGLTLDDSAESQAWHPLFRRHPISGKVALFLSTPERCQRLSNTKDKDASRIIRLLYQHSIRHYRIYRHHWKAGDIVIWDDRCTMHRADHSKVVGDRVLHRGLISGEVPLSAGAGVANKAF